MGDPDNDTDRTPGGPPAPVTRIVTLDALAAEIAARIERIEHDEAPGAARASRHLRLRAMLAELDARSRGGLRLSDPAGDMARALGNHPATAQMDNAEAIALALVKATGVSLSARASTVVTIDEAGPAGDNHPPSDGTDDRNPA